MTKRRSHTPALNQMARERIGILFKEAGREVAVRPELSTRYIEIARKIAMRQRIRIDRDLRRQYCHRCHAFLAPGRTMRVRVHDGRVVVTCCVCNKKTRYHLEKHHVRHV